jgi:hypothetical protein
MHLCVPVASFDFSIDPAYYLSSRIVRGLFRKKAANG